MFYSRPVVVAYVKYPLKKIVIHHCTLFNEGANFELPQAFCHSNSGTDNDDLSSLVFHACLPR